MLEALEELDFFEDEPVVPKPKVDESSLVDEAFDRLVTDLANWEFFDQLLDATLQAGRHTKLDPPCSVDFLLDMAFDTSGQPSELLFHQAPKLRNWSSYMTNNEQTPESQQERTEILASEVIEELLNHPIGLSTDSSPDKTLALLHQLTFDLKNHPYYVHPHNPTSDWNEESKGLVLMIPDYKTKDSVKHCHIDNSLAVSNFPIEVPNPAITYPFELDDFQKRAIMRLEKNQNVFVAAHTSAGKTVVAEYAIALSRRRMSRVFYTSPIKALSNQKYRELKNKFKEVGIMTGDVAVDTESFCLIMTTEVLRSMLYKGSPKIRDLEWVILDEVHYINDPERGVVWEEVLIMLPPHVHVVMLSATVPNYEEFTEWVGKTRKQKVYVQCTTKRPVPLIHSAYMLGNLVKLMDQENTQNFHEYSLIARNIETCARTNPKSKQRNRKSGKRDFRKMAASEDTRYTKLIQDLKHKDLLPCVLFAFSRDKADARATKLSRIDLLEDGAKAAVQRFIDKVLKRLEEIDRELPQVAMVTTLLLQGVGVHHSGILPILKEMVEILFSKGILKVLVATETFAMGLNMPTKTVVFSEIRKFDGNDNRYLQPGEYTQMSGRAGRRGIDQVGNVIIFIKDSSSPPSTKILKDILQSKPLSLTSKFRLRYNMIASLLMNETMDIQDLISKSYRENSGVVNHNKIAMLKAKKNQLRSSTSIEVVAELEMLKELFKINCNECSSFNKKSLTQGSFIVILNEEFALLDAIVISAGTESIKVLAVSNTSILENKFGNLSYGYLSIKYTHIVAAYKPPPKGKFKVTDGSRINKDQCESYLQQTQAAKKTTRSTSRQLFKAVPDNREELVETCLRLGLINSPDRHQNWRDFNEAFKLDKQIEETGAEGGESGDQYDSMVMVMREFGLTDSKGMLALKGRSISPVTNPYCLVICECVFRGVLQGLNEIELPAFFCIFVAEGKSVERSDWNELSPALNESLQHLFEVHQEILKCEQTNQVDNELTRKLTNSLIEPVFMWASGKPFVEICGQTDIKEGNIVRAILRTHELLGNLCESAVMIGDVVLKQRLEGAQAKMRRDIVFATSLYIKQ